MDRPSHGNPTEVSAYWTPQHLDVTDAPVHYAPPKATWIDGFQRLRPAVKSDAVDRMARRRLQTRAIVDPTEIMPIPPVTIAVETVDRTPAWLDELREISRLVRPRRRAV